MKEPAVGLVEAACAVGLGEVGVEAEEDAGDAEGDGVVEDLAEGCGGDGEGGVGHVSDHDGVDNAHRHPANFGEDEGKGEREHGPDLGADGHLVSCVLACRGTYSPRGVIAAKAINTLANPRDLSLTRKAEQASQ